MRTAFYFLFFFSSLTVFSQIEDSVKTTVKTVNPAIIHYQGEQPTNQKNKEALNYVKWDSLIIDADERIELLSASYFESKKIRGYKIQIFSGNSRFEATKVKSDFINKFKEATPPELMYQTPNFKLRVGNYRDRLQAQKDLVKYKEEFPSAFLVKDEIEVSFEED